MFIDHSKFTLLTQETKPLRYDSNKDFLEADKECLYQKYYWGKAEFCQKSNSKLTCCNYLQDRQEKTTTDKMIAGHYCEASMQLSQGKA